jgi:hypothetical protein
MAQGASPWQVAASGAKLDCGPLQGSVVLDPQSACFLVERWQNRSLYGLNVLTYFGPSATAGDLGLAETYTRGSDFVATFAEGGRQHVTPQLYWRAHCFEDLGAASLELIVSVKTDLLDSHPLSRTHSLVSSEATILHATSLAAPQFETLKKPGQHSTRGAGRAVRFDASTSHEHLFLFRLPEHDLSFAQLIHPSDYVAAELGIDTEPPYSLLATLFPERLEKGVIRRGRLCGMFRSIKNDLEVAAELARLFVNEPLQLAAYGGLCPPSWHKAF